MYLDADGWHHLVARLDAVLGSDGPLDVVRVADCLTPVLCDTLQRLRAEIEDGAPAVAGDLLSGRCRMVKMENASEGG